MSAESGDLYKVRGGRLVTSLHLDTDSCSRDAANPDSLRDALFEFVRRC
jgi:hypothetical protein